MTGKLTGRQYDGYTTAITRIRERRDDAATAIVGSRGGVTAFTECRVYDGREGPPLRR